MDNLAAIEEKLNDLTSKMGIVIMESKDAEVKVKQVEKTRQKMEEFASTFTAKADEISVLAGKTDVCNERLEKLEVKLQQAPPNSKLEELKAAVESMSKKIDMFGSVKKDIDNLNQALSGITEEIGDTRDSISAVSENFAALEKSTGIKINQFFDSAKMSIAEISIKMDKLASAPPSEGGVSTPEADQANLLRIKETEAKILALVESIDSLKKELASQTKTVEEKAVIRDAAVKALQKTADLLREEIAKVKSDSSSAQGTPSQSVDPAVVEEFDKKLKDLSTRYEQTSSKLIKDVESALANNDKVQSAIKRIDEIEKKAANAPAPPVAAALASKDDDDAESYENISPDGELGFELNDLLQVMIKHQASDLHLKEGAPPTVRLEGDLIPIGSEILSDKNCKYLILSGMPKRSRKLVFDKKEIDFAYSIPEARFRVHAFLQKGTVSASYRMLKTTIPSIESLHLPISLKTLANSNNGLILVTGPAGSGKSTTLASMVDFMNTNRKLHIVTVEDPIEYIHTDKLSLVTQREVGNDTLSFLEALKSSLRQDPNVILIGEMRDAETVMTAAMAAETGHLVLSTLHTPNAIQAIHRVIDTFPPDQQNQFRILLASTLRGVISQRLINRIDGDGRIPAVEVMVVTPTISSLIAENNLSDIYPLMVEGKGEGMQTFTQSLTELFEAGIISKEDAMFNAEQRTEFRLGVEGYTDKPNAIQDDVMMSWL